IYSVAHVIDCGEGRGPVAPLTLGPDGDLYGTTVEGGSNELGIVFKISTSGAFTVLANLDTTTGGWVYGPLAVDAERNVYGAGTFQTGSYSGTIFKIAADGDASTIYAFNNTENADGTEPDAGLVFGLDGVLYGATLSGGATEEGVLFSVTTDGT